MTDLTLELQQQVKTASASGTSLEIIGGGSKSFYGREINATPLKLSAHTGIIDYQPSELVLTARSGTKLVEIEAELEKHGQCLPFEPPQFSSAATIGGAIASGLSGPVRPWGGAPRDAVLGVKILDGRGQILNFGGQVMKNVAGYDLSRLMAGAMGCLGVLLEVSVKVLPRSASDWTLGCEDEPDEIRTLLERLMLAGEPLTASYQNGNKLLIRLSCSEANYQRVKKAYPVLSDEALPGFWQQLRDHQLDYFKTAKPLWRLVTPQSTKLQLPDPMISEWAGGLHWLSTDLAADEVRGRVANLGGYADFFKGPNKDDRPFHPLPGANMALHRRLKVVFDPDGILNPGRMYPEF